MDERKLMVVEGYTVPAAVEDGILAWVRSMRREFTASDVKSKAYELGVPSAPVKAGIGPWGPVHRIVDRILQRERRAGRVEFASGRWRRVPSPTDPSPSAGGDSAGTASLREASSSGVPVVRVGSWSTHTAHEGD